MKITITEEGHLQFFKVEFDYTDFQTEESYERVRALNLFKHHEKILHADISIEEPFEGTGITSLTLFMYSDINEEEVVTISATNASPSTILNTAYENRLSDSPIYLKALCDGGYLSTLSQGKGVLTYFSVGGRPRVHRPS